MDHKTKKMKIMINTVYKRVIGHYRPIKKKESEQYGNT